MSQTLRDRGEAALLDEIRRLLPARAGVLVGPGDDAAVLPPSRHPLLLTTDALVEGVHFQRRWLTARALGWRAFAVNASDVAAMGGRPRAAVLAVAAPPELPAMELRDMVRGVRTAARAAGAALVGGNLAASRALSLTIALLGDVPERAVTRAGGRPGDRVFVTGTLGDAALGLRLIERPRSIRGGDAAVRRWQRPRARLRAGLTLARQKLAAAMIDLSDGLLIDAGRLCAASDVGAVLHADRVPLSATLRALAPTVARNLALAGGEDYELLFAVRPARLAALARARRALGCRITHVGELVRGRGVRIVDGEGRPVALGRRVGHEHFAA